MDKASKKQLIDNIIHNGVIAKITASATILLLSAELVQSFDCMENANVVLPVLSGVLGGTMMFLFVKKDGK